MKLVRVGINDFLCGEVSTAQDALVEIAKLHNLDLNRLVWYRLADDIVKNYFFILRYKGETLYLPFEDDDTNMIHYEIYENSKFAVCNPDYCLRIVIS